MKIDEENKKGKKLKVSSELVLHFVQHSTSNTIVTNGKHVGIEKSIMDNYNYLNFQAQKERETNEEKLRNSKLHSLISALDRKINP